MDILGDKDYIKINRSILYWEHWSDLNTCRLFFFLILKANWKDGCWRGIEVKRGSLITSFKKLVEDTDLSVDEIRTSIKKLVKSGEITKQSTNKYTVFTVCNYELYQGNSQSIPDEIPIHSKPIPKQIPNKSQPIPNPFPTIEEGKKERREEEKDLKKDVEYHFQEIVDYLNTKAGTNYRGNSGDTKKYIKARFAEGYSLEDFKTVIDKKVAEWGNEPKDGDKDMRQYLRPSTLFSSKFESYLNQQPVKITKNKSNSFNQFSQNDYDFETLETELLKN